MKVGDTIYTRLGVTREVDFLPVPDLLIVKGVILQIEPTNIPSYRVEIELSQLAGTDDYNMLAGKKKKEKAIIETIEVYKTKKDASY